MKPVTKYQSDDGYIYDSELEATRADAAYHKERSERLARIEADREASHRHDPGYSVHDGNGHM